MSKAILDLAAALVTEADDLAELRRLSEAAAAGDAAAFLALCRLTGESGDPVTALATLDGFSETDLASRVGSLVIRCFAAVRAPYRAQSDAIAARTTLGALADALYPDVSDQLGSDALDFLVRLAGEAIVQISRSPASRVPLVRVETALSLPSSLLAYDLYQDPSRGAEIVERNRSATPLLMPTTIEALSV